MTDYISREDLLDLYSLDGLTDEEQSYGVPYAIVRQTILDMPAADVVPKRKHESRKLLPCTCGRKRITLWHGADGQKFCACENCDKKGLPAKTEIQARRNWNTMIAAEMRGEGE